MANSHIKALLLSLAIALCSPAGPAHGFWFASSRAKSQPAQWFGIRDYGVAAQAAYSFDSTGGVAVAVPVAVPLPPNHLQVSPPYPGLGAVQLVPCLCPISKDPEHVKPLPPPSSAVAGPPPPPPPHFGNSVQSVHPLHPLHPLHAMQATHAMQAVQPAPPTDEKQKAPQ